MLSQETLNQIDEELTLVRDDLEASAEKALTKNPQSLRGKADRYRAKNITQLLEKIETEAS